MPGLKPEACNGDITLSFCYKPSLSGCSMPEEVLKGDRESTIDGVKEQVTLIPSTDNEEL